MTRTFTLAAPVALAAASLLALPAQAAWPEKPITMLVGFKAGGGADTLGRIVSKAIAAKHGWKFVIKNKSGAGGGVMAKTLKKEKKDGYTIGMAVVDPFAFNPVVKKNVGYTADDFVYLGTIAKAQMGIMAMKEKGWNTLDDAMKAAKAKGSMSIGSMGLRLTMASKLIARHYGVNLKIVPARGGRGVMNQLLGGHVDIGWGAGIQGRYVQAGKMVILASANDEPLKQDPAKKTLGPARHAAARYLRLLHHGRPEGHAGGSREQDVRRDRGSRGLAGCEEAGQRAHEAGCRVPRSGQAHGPRQVGRSGGAEDHRSSEEVAAPPIPPPRRRGRSGYQSGWGWRVERCAAPRGVS